MGPSVLLLLITSTLVALTQADREHKVHNIILYPDRHSWCQTTPIQQIVASPGYEPVTIDNNVCVGACFSYSIPRTQPAEPGELIGPYCDSCQPVNSKCYHVTLKESGNDNSTFRKRVQIIMKCSCMSCDGNQNEDCDITDLTTSELPSDLFSDRIGEDSGRDEIPELFGLQNTSVVNNPPTTLDERQYDINTKLIEILAKIQNVDNDEIDSNYDRSLLNDLIRIVKGTDRNLTDRNLMEFVNYVNGNYEDLELDVNTLKEVLEKFEKEQTVADIHRKFGLTLGAKNNEDIERDLVKYNMPKNFGLEGKVPNQINHHHHHLEDEMHLGSDIGRLVKGPHGSMVMAPLITNNIKVEEKLNIDSDILKPNHDGTIISYENPLEKNNRSN